jgi:uncharacterized protein YdeI (YjbR/CyaY-like superfamily)
MGTRDPRVDAYIDKSADFAKPILRHLREVVHTACPDAQETMKWSFPHFDYKGMLCSMAAFKEHSAFTFWKGALIFGEVAKSQEAMGHMGRITSVGDLPPKKELIRLIKEAVRLNDDGVKLPSRSAPREPRKVPDPPDELAAALAKNKKAQKAFEKLPPSHKREYIEWITEAKGEATRKRRIDQAMEWIAEGKSRNWKYERT